MRLKFFKIILFIICLLYICVYCYRFSNNKIYSNNINNTNSLKISSNVISKISNNISEIKENKDINYLARINIPKIGINRYLYNIDSKMNNVNKNIEILKGSDMPDAENGNFILAAHSGYSSIAYFHNLYKLEIGDIVILNYKNNNYKYIVSDMYDVLKTGKITVKRDKNKTAITMITCKGEDKQLVVIGYRQD